MWPRRRGASAPRRMWNAKSRTLVSAAHGGFPVRAFCGSVGIPPRNVPPMARVSWHLQCAHASAARYSCATAVNQPKSGRAPACVMARHPHVLERHSHSSAGHHGTSTHPRALPSFRKEEHAMSLRRCIASMCCRTQRTPRPEPVSAPTRTAATATVVQARTAARCGQEA